MSVEENKAVLRRYFEEVWNKGSHELLDELVAPTYENHDPAVPGLPRGPEGLKPIIAGFRAAFPDLHVTIDDQIAEGDKVVTRYTMRGTHRGAFMGLPATGKHLSVGGIQIERVVQGQIVGHWRRSADLGMMQQLGELPRRELGAG